MVSLKRKNCNVGWNCGGACIPRKHRCPSQEGSATAEALSLVSSLISQGDGSSSSSSTHQTLDDFDEKEINNIAKGVATFFSPAEKKAAREYIAKQPNSKELKKERILDEQAAWVFHKTFKKREALLKKAKRTGSLEDFKEAENLLTTLKQLAVGDKDTLAITEKAVYKDIEKNKEVKKNKKEGAVANKKLEEISGLITSAASPPPVATTTITAASASNETNSPTIYLAKKVEVETEHQKRLLAIANGEKLDYAVKITVVKKKNEENGIAETSEKIVKLKKAGLSSEEAHGVAAWISSEYKPLNQAIWGEEKMRNDDKEYGIAAGILAAKGIKKLKSYDEKVMKVQAKKARMKLLPEGQVNRTIEIKEEVLEEFLRPYREAASSSSGEFREPTFLAGTTLSTPFNNTANVVYEISAKKGGQSAGKMVDEYKNINFEGEVLYPPYSKFKILKIEDGSPAVRIARPKKANMVKGDKAKELNKFPQKLFDEKTNELNVGEAQYFATILSLYHRFEGFAAKQGLNPQTGELLEAGFNVKNLPSKEYVEQLQKQIDNYQEERKKKERPAKPTKIIMEEL